MKLFLALKCSDIVFIALINVKMQINFMLSSVEHEHFLYPLGLSIKNRFQSYINFK